MTDADLVLGYLDPGYFLGGRLPLHRRPGGGGPAGAHRGAPGAGPVAPPWAVHQVVNEQMAAAARMHAVEKGKDARRFPLFAFGGAGPVHACRVAGILGVREVLCPFGAGVGSTVGLLAAPAGVRLRAQRLRPPGGGRLGAPSPRSTRRWRGRGGACWPRPASPPQDVTAAAHGGHAPLRAGPPDLRARPGGPARGGGGPGRAGRLRGGLPHPVPAHPARGWRWR